MNHDGDARAGAARHRVAAFAGSALAAALILTLVGCQSSGADASAKSNHRSSSETTADAMAQDAFDAGAGKPPTAATMYSLARILAAKGETSQAVGVLRNLLQRYPDYSPAYNALAEAYLSVDRTDDARAALTAGVKRSPKDPVLLNNLGMVHFMQGDYESAIAYFDRAAAVVPGEPMYTSNKAAALGMLGRVVESADLYRKHLRQASVFENMDILMRARKTAAGQVSGLPPTTPTQEVDAMAKRAATQPSASGSASGKRLAEPSAAVAAQ
ncbi:MAG: tetratricopeptide repeat protein [Tepidisphaeraceae bacterium]